MERVPTLKSELREIVEQYRGHIIATSACMGGELSTNAYLMSEAQRVENMEAAQYHYKQIQSFMSYAIDLFGSDFYIECAPSTRKDQIVTNKKLASIANAYGVKMVVGTDAHYLTKEDRLIHKAYLNSKEGEREVDDFYEFAHLMSPDECKELLKLAFDEQFIEQIYINTLEIQSKIEWYSLERKQIIPKVAIKSYSAWDIW